MVPIISIIRFVYKWILSFALDCKISKVYLLTPLSLQVLHDFSSFPVQPPQKGSEIHSY